jgi:DNA polymerase
MGEKRGISKIRGQWLEWEGRLVMPIFHPSYLLRNQSREQGSPKWLTWQDVKAIKEKYLELVSTDTNVNASIEASVSASVVVDEDEEF